MKKCSLIVFLFLTIGRFANSTDLEDIIYFTEDYPPFNYMKDGKLEGISIELLELMLKKLGSEKTRKDFIHSPWARGYTEAQNNPRACVFIMTRNPLRENMFKWVGPIEAEPTAIIAKKDRNIKIESLEMLNEYKIGVVRDDISEILLLQNNVDEENLFRSTIPNQLGMMLYLNRIDLWAYGKGAAYLIIKNTDLNTDDFEVVFNISPQNNNYFAFHKEIPDKIIENFQAAFDELVTDGTYQKIIDKYIK